MTTRQRYKEALDAAYAAVSDKSLIDNLLDRYNEFVKTIQEENEKESDLATAIKEREEAEAELIRVRNELATANILLNKIRQEHPSVYKKLEIDKKND